MPLPPEIVKQLEREKREFEDQMFAMQQRIKQINELLNHAKNLSINWSEKAMNCLRADEFPMTTDEILRCVFARDLEELDNPIRRRNYIMQLSLALNRLSGKGLIVGTNIDGHRGKIYYLKTWEDESGNLTLEYQYKYDLKCKKLLQEKNKSDI